MGIIYAEDAEEAIVDKNAYHKKGTSPEIQNLSPGDFEKSVENIRNKGKDVKDEYPTYPGEVYKMPDGSVFGIRQGEEATSGVRSIDNMNKGKEGVKTRKWKEGGERN